MMPNTQEMLYTAAVLADDLNRQHRDEMMRRAEHARLVRAASDDRATLTRTVMSWAGRRLVSSGHYLLSRAERQASDMPLSPIEQL